MNEYQKQAKDFLQKANASMSIRLVGKAFNQDWDEKVLRNLYNIEIKTPRGTMLCNFWDSIRDTEMLSMTEKEFTRKMFKCEYRDLTPEERSQAHDEFVRKRKDAVPTEYDVLACLTKCDPGTFRDFCLDYGFDSDPVRAVKTYFAVQEEYDNLCKIFTREQLEELAEIQ